MDKKYITTTYKETQNLGKDFAKELLKLSLKNSSNNKSIVLALHGNLGGGKTTFLQGFAKGLGIKEKILSPTYVVMKRYGNFYHFDCYRLKDEKDILELGWKAILSNPKNIVVIEWPERIKKVLPKNAIKITFTAIGDSEREIDFKI
ncbi:MAG: tRNA (adenosine(37)-N6)-threonylcarbamoyltransferase complex ATPase subunit type 1 TsaE [Candidatus Staskawiczbacteria bacterium]|nr:tRNA (adenosine(37)-N6)-threonylcarbamoyltransferase complex ATPase subunit type 1 TsaE [Candidatus Staskawiczbacteria bacterium]